MRSDIVPVDDLPRMGPVFAQAIAAGDPYDFEARIRRFDGIYRWCQVRGLPWRDTNGLIMRSNLWRGGNTKPAASPGRHST